jgi:4-amino-4-deoxy-L-arabinose transferase-like glycosyltransferase
MKLNYFNVTSGNYEQKQNQTLTIRLILISIICILLIILIWYYTNPENRNYIKHLNEEKLTSNNRNYESTIYIITI